jgi:hypothetical protein
MLRYPFPGKATLLFGVSMLTLNDAMKVIRAAQKKAAAIGLP